MENIDVVQRTKDLLSCVIQNNGLTPEDKKEIHEFLLNTIKRFSDYVQITNEYVYKVHSISELRAENIISQDEFERQLKEIDHSRRSKHNLIIDACNQLNRQCNFYNIPIICEIDTQNRYEVADFAAYFTMITHGYAINHNYTMDEVIEKMQKDKNLLHSQLNIFQEGINYDE